MLFTSTASARHRHLLQAIAPVVLSMWYLAATARAAEISSDFSVDSDGWTVTSGGSLAWVGVGGNPSGHLQLTDTASGFFSVVAPAKFHGDLSGFDGGQLSLELSQVFDNSGADLVPAGELTIAGPGGSLTIDVVCAGLDSNWTKIEVPLHAESWGVPTATWDAVLADVDSIEFVSDFLNLTGDVLGIDNIVLSDGAGGSCVTIDFEDASAVCGVDDLPITDRYQAQCGVVFGIDSDDDGFIDGIEAPQLEATGGAGDGPFGFNNNGLGLKDTADAGLEPRLGGFLLRGEVPLAPVTLIILYDVPVAAASGEIWDIDFGASEGTEQWRVEALGADYATGMDPNDVVDVSTSPEGLDSTLDGRPWVFSFDRPSADIYALRLIHIGTDTTGVGLAFDNLSPTSPAPQAVSTLSTWGLLALAATMSLVSAYRIGRAHLPRKSCDGGEPS